MNRITFIIVALIALGVSLLIFAPGLIPVAAYKARLEASASEVLGRQVTVGDELSFRIFPRTSFQVKELEIANAEGFEGDTIARVSEADLGVKFFALLSGFVQVDRFVLTEPEITLIRNADGQVNWNLAGAAPQEGAGASSGNGPNAIKDLRLGDVRIVEGRATYRDDAAGQSFTAENINLNIILKSLSEPLEAQGVMTFQGAPAQIDIVATTLAQMLAGEPANVKIEASLGAASAGADLTLTAPEAGADGSDGGRYSGPVRIEAPDLSALAALFGVELAEAPGFDSLDLSGDIDGDASDLRLSNTRIGFDDIEAEGVLTLAWTGVRPKAGGVLSTESLDLRPYMPPPAETAEGFPAWSEAPMDFTSLRNIDAELDISTNAILLNDLNIGESRLLLTIDNGRLSAEIPELSMYGGQGSGQLVVNARQATPSFAGNFDMGAVEAQHLSLDLFKHDNLLGLGSFNFNFTASGASQAAIMSSMDGGGGFDLADGALKGINIAGIARAASGLRQGVNPAALASAVAEATSPAEQTDFTEFLSDFTIENGNVTAPTISMSGPFMAMNGNGSVNLPAQTIDLRLSPRATSTADGADGRAVSVPLRVSGTFSQPSVSIDAEALLRGGAEETIRDLFKGVTGGENSATGEDGEQGEQSLEETLLNEGLNALFGRRNNQPSEQEDPDRQ